MPEADDIRFVDVWRRADAKVAADVVAFWKRLDVLPAGIAPEERAKELCTVAYRGGELIGVSTMVLDVLPQLKARFGFFRCLVAPDYAAICWRNGRSAIRRKRCSAWRPSSKAQRSIC